MDKVNDGVSKFNIWDNYFLEHENTFNLMYNICGLYKGGQGEKDPQKISFKNIQFLASTCTPATTYSPFQSTPTHGHLPIMSLPVSGSSQPVKSSQSEKSSQYNRKRASVVSHTQCVCHIGCSSQAASSNMGIS